MPLRAALIPRHYEEMRNADQPAQAGAGYALIAPADRPNTKIRLLAGISAIS